MKRIRTNLVLILLLILGSCKVVKGSDPAEEISKFLDGAKVSLIEEQVDSLIHFKIIIDGLKVNNLNEVNNLCSISSLILFGSIKDKIHNYDYVDILLENSTFPIKLRYTIDDLFIIDKLTQKANTFLYGIAYLNKDSISSVYKPYLSVDKSVDELILKLEESDLNQNDIIDINMKGFKFYKEDDKILLNMSGYIEYKDNVHIIDMFFDPNNQKMIGYDL